LVIFGLFCLGKLSAKIKIKESQAKKSVAMTHGDNKNLAEMVFLLFVFRRRRQQWYFFVSTVGLSGW